MHLLQALAPHRLQAQEEHREAGVGQQGQQLLIVRHLHRDLGGEGQRPLLAAVPVDQRRQQLLGEGLVAEEVVVGEEDGAAAGGVGAPHLVHDLVDLLGAVAVPQVLDHVTEVTAVGAAAAGLHAHVEVVVRLDQRPVGARAAGQVDVLALLVARRGPARAPVAQKARPGQLGLAHEEVVRQPLALLGADAGEGAAQGHGHPAGAEGGAELADPRRVEGHPGEHHQVAVQVQVDRLDVLVAVNVLHRDVVGGQSHQGGQRRVGHQRGGAEDLHGPLHRPERLGVSGRHQVDLASADPPSVAFDVHQLGGRHTIVCGVAHVRSDHGGETHRSCRRPRGGAATRPLRNELDQIDFRSCFLGRGSDSRRSMCLLDKLPQKGWGGSRIRFRPSFSASILKPNVSPVRGSPAARHWPGDRRRSRRSGYSRAGCCGSQS